MPVRSLALFSISTIGQKRLNSISWSQGTTPFRQYLVEECIVVTGYVRWKLEGLPEVRQARIRISKDELYILPLLTWM